MGHGFTSNDPEAVLVRCRYEEFFDSHWIGKESNAQMQVSNRFKTSIPLRMPKFDLIENIRTRPRLLILMNRVGLRGKINFSKMRDGASI
jgi:hypothetical protein